MSVRQKKMSPLRLFAAWVAVAVPVGVMLGLVHGWQVAVDNGYFEPGLRSVAAYLLQEGAFQGARLGLVGGILGPVLVLLAWPIFWLIRRTRDVATAAAVCAVACGALFAVIGYHVNVEYLPHLFSAMSLLVNGLLATCFVGLWWLTIRVIRQYRDRGGGWSLSSRASGVLLLLAAIMIGGASALRYAWSAVPSANSPNILFVLIDTLRADRLGAYGYQRDTSPNIDRLSEDGWLFTDGIAQASWTKPSMASIFTGLYANQTSVRPGSWALASNEGAVKVHTLAPEHLTMTEVLAAAGYRTAAFGKNHHLLPTLGFSQGFETYHWAKAQTRRFRFLSYAKRLFPGLWTEWVNEPEFWSEWIHQNFLEWLDDKKDERFFAYLHHIDVHWPYRSPPPFSGMYSDVESPVDFNQPAFMPDTVDGLRSGELESLDPRILAAMSNAYDEGIRYVDDRLGKLFDELKQRGLYDNTLIIVTADHGEEFLEHGLLGHGESLYDEVIRVPLIAKFPCPGSHCGHRKIGSQVELVDIFPTIMEVAGLKPPEVLVGRSLADPAGGVRNAFSEWDQSISLRTPQWKLIYDRQNDLGKLYDILEDPGETKNRLPTEAELGDILIARLLDFTATHQSLVAADASSVTADERMLENLKALGYVQ